MLGTGIYQYDARAAPAGAGRHSDEAAQAALRLLSQRDPGWTARLRWARSTAR
jgi:hypothetical protein